MNGRCSLPLRDQCGRQTHQGDDEGGLSMDDAGAMFRADIASQAVSQKEELTGDCR